MCRITIVAENESRSQRIGEVLGENAPCKILAMADMELEFSQHHFAPADLIVVDFESNLQPMGCLFASLNRNHPEAIIIAIVPAEYPFPAETLMQLGVDEIIIRPAYASQMGETTQRLLQRISFFDRMLALKEKLRQEMRQSQIVAKSKAMHAIIQRLPQLAASLCTVLITGETGTGKELIARAIHYLGTRAGHPFITIDCGTMPENLVENELFGHVRGAYTDAGPPSKGLIQEADGGTLFLDEVESLPLSVQAKFLRFLQERQYKPLGQSKYVSVNVRVLAATNVDLARAVEKKTFREDLYFRLNVVPLFIPPLRERKADIPALVHHFLQRYAQNSLMPAEVPQEILRSWQTYHWPGNVRELENKVQEWLTLAHIDNEPHSISFSNAAPNLIRPLVEVRHEALASCDRTYLLNLLRHTKGNLSAAARLAGIDRKNLRALLKKYGIEAHRFRH
jgi:DNA-binding NtrC family response regulator